VITLTKIRELDLAPGPGRARMYLTAASGLVCAGPFLYVVADDELELGVFHIDEAAPGRLVRLFEGELPPANPDRKKQKPDLETLTLLPPFANFPNGALVALGSGSKRHRRRSAVFGLDAQGGVRDSARVVDLSAIFDCLDRYFPSLNIEGAVVVATELRLFQRGNKRNSENAIIRLPLPPFLDALNEGPASGIEPLAITKIDLGRYGAIPFSFTDAAALPNGEVVFTAVAEDTDDTYADGPCTAAAIGIVDSDGSLRRFLPLDVPLKVEGVDARVEDDLIRLLLVTDADDPAIPAILYSATMER
jgi:hypothetical protein